MIFLKILIQPRTMKVSFSHAIVIVVDAAAAVVKSGNSFPLIM